MVEQGSRDQGIEGSSRRAAAAVQAAFRPVGRAQRPLAATRSRSARLLRGVAALLALLFAPAARATWSIILIDSRTGEIGVAGATCLAGLDLTVYLPVVRVGSAAACAQSLIDQNATNRRRIRTDMIAGMTPENILADLIASDSQFRQRQYGIVDVLGNTVTYSGTANGPYAGGVTGHLGTIAYAIQGNVLTGAPVVAAAEAAVLNTPGDLPAKLMAAMEAARAMGGDGRCSCNVSNPTSCGSPPPNFTKAAHVGFFIIARRGDEDGVCNRTIGCATGTYFTRLNVANAAATDPDPVLQLRDMFDMWRAGLLNVPDAIRSSATITPDHLVGGGAATLRIELRDWSDQPATTLDAISVTHDPAGSAGISAIGAPVSLGGGVFEVPLTNTTGAGRDVFQISVATGGGRRDVILSPSPSLVHADPIADLDNDGDVDQADLKILIDHYGKGPIGDLNGDGLTDLIDLALMLRSL